MENTTFKCRLCLKNVSKKVDIFKHDFPKMIELLTGIQADPNDDLPKESCLDCAKNVKFCISVRKQIIKSHKILLNKHNEYGNATLGIKSEIPATCEESVQDIPRCTRKRPRTPDTTNEELSTDCEDSYEKANTDLNTSESGNIAQEIMLNYDVKDPILSMEDTDVKIMVETTKEDSKTENESPPNQQISSVRLLRKKKLIAASNRILKQTKSDDRRYSNVIFIRKSMREKIRKQNQNEKPKPKQDPSDDLNVIWKNGKKYAACEICKREVKKHYLKHHMTIHFPEHFSCDICGVTTRNLRGLRYHKLYWHSSKLDYICDKCGKKYRSKHALDLHSKKEHGGERDLECNICGKKFFQNMHLKRHIDGIHKKLRPHKCEYCGKDFTKRTHLVTHWRTHTNETPYACDMCGERFKLKLSLKNHLRRAHNFEEKESVFCDICNRGFATEQGLRAHINSRVHEGEKCQYCSESFTTEYLKVHLREVHMHIDFC
ncbi:hypothetical protein ABEB36_004322 [Hypothenemus hampei]|uniref:Uncharacterized protein n=1 Tax=Hypothenemus hampei TaxID=57062 RepID=A0ABD1F2Z1_HYPHA